MYTYAKVFCFLIIGVLVIQSFALFLYLQRYDIENNNHGDVKDNENFGMQYSKNKNTGPI